MIAGNLLVRGLFAVGLLCGSRLCSADPIAEVNQIQLIEKELDWISQIASYQFTVDVRFSNSHPENHWLVTYRESKDKYFYDATHISTDPKQNQMYTGDAESWDGATGM